MVGMSFLFPQDRWGIDLFRVNWRTVGNEIAGLSPDYGRLDSQGENL